MMAACIEERVQHDCVVVVRSLHVYDYADSVHSPQGPYVLMLGRQVGGSCTLHS
jgi:hypothetical protein